MTLFLETSPLDRIKFPPVNVWDTDCNFYEGSTQVTGVLTHVCLTHWAKFERTVGTYLIIKCHGEILGLSNCFCKRKSSCTQLSLFRIGKLEGGIANNTNTSQGSVVGRPTNKFLRGHLYGHLIYPLPHEWGNTPSGSLDPLLTKMRIRNHYFC